MRKKRNCTTEEENAEHGIHKSTIFCEETLNCQPFDLVGFLFARQIVPTVVLCLFFKSMFNSYNSVMLVAIIAKLLRKCNDFFKAIHFIACLQSMKKVARQFVVYWLYRVVRN